VCSSRAKGYMYPALGNQWTMLYTLPAVSWDPPRPVDSSCKATVIQGLQYEIGLLNASNPSVPGDFYYWGGAAAAQARLALIACVFLRRRASC
jgi:endo-1,3(4)-beta-glucanase